MDEAERRRRLAQKLFQMRKSQLGDAARIVTSPPPKPAARVESKSVLKKPAQVRTRSSPKPAKPADSATSKPRQRRRNSTPLPPLENATPKRVPRPGQPLTRSNPERVLTNPGMRIVYDAAKATELEIDFVIDSSRLCAQSRFEINRRLTEIHHVRRATEKKKQLFARVQFSRSRVVFGELDHLVLIDLEEHGVLSAYRFTSEYLKWRLFSKRRERAELLIPINGKSVFDLYRLDWPLKRPRPAD